MTKFYAGLDIGSTFCELAVIADSEKMECVFSRKVPTAEFSLKELIHSAKQRVRGDLLLAMEECEMAHWISNLFTSEVNELIICEPKHNAWIAKDSHKNDKIDAHKLAKLFRGGFLKPVFHTNSALRYEFRRSVLQYHQITDSVRIAKCQLKSVFRIRGVIVKGKSIFTKRNREKFVNLLPNDESKRMAYTAYKILDNAMESQKEAFEQMVSIGRNFKEVALFDKVPGVGPVWACTFSAIVQTPFRFKNKRKLWQYSRLGITDKSSDGKPLGRKKLDRNGVALLKQLSYRVFCSCMAMSKETEFKKKYHQSLKRTGSQTHARLNVQRHILAVLYGMFKRMEEYKPFNEEKTNSNKNITD